MWTPCNASIQRSRVQHVALDDLGAGLHTGPHLLRAAGQAAELHRPAFPAAGSADRRRSRCRRSAGSGAGFHRPGSPSVLIPRSENPSCCAFYGLPVLKIAGAVRTVFEGRRCCSCAGQRRKRSGISGRPGQTRSHLLGGGRNRMRVGDRSHGGWLEGIVEGSKGENKRTESRTGAARLVSPSRRRRRTDRPEPTRPRQRSTLTTCVWRSCRRLPSCSTPASRSRSSPTSRPTPPGRGPNSSSSPKRSSPAIPRGTISASASACDRPRGVTNSAASSRAPSKCRDRPPSSSARSPRITPSISSSA